MSFHPAVTDVQPAHRLAWLGYLDFPVVRRHCIFTLTPRPNGADLTRSERDVQRRARLDLARAPHQDRSQVRGHAYRAQQTGQRTPANTATVPTPIGRSCSSKRPGRAILVAVTVARRPCGDKPRPLADYRALIRARWRASSS